MARFDQYKDAYERNWANLTIRTNRAAEVKKQAKRVLGGKSTYLEIEKRTGVPWWFIGLCHYRESSLDFDTYLGNGQPLSRRTTIVPKGRGPFTGPNAFIDGAIDALRLEGFIGATDWGIARTLYRLEGFNGYGYHDKEVNSPYLYGGSNVYGPPEARPGKYVSDHHFDPNVVDSQLGTATILKSLLDLAQLDESLFSANLTNMQPEDEDEIDIQWLQRSLNLLGASPTLTEDGKNGPRTRTAVSQFQQDNSLVDTGLADAGTISAITKLLQQFPATNAENVNVRLSSLESSINALRAGSDQSQQVISQNLAGQGSTNDLASVISALGGAIQQIQATLPSTRGTTVQNDRLRQAMDLLNAALSPTGIGRPSLGPVNGALGDIAGSMLNGKKSAIGIGGAVLTQLLSQVPTDTGLGQVLAQLTPAAGLSPFAMPIFLGLASWGVLGKFEKWVQGKTPSLPN